ncbi:MAG: translation elongation factor Ts [Pseudomonadota bacterium]|nr:translation elongation factor Ts [Pseudomonadota bacterium]MEC9481557.1 translation elongation factor Ts [Pseudomonadota bacterium]
MSDITANLVKELREKTGVGMMDCKTALLENNGDIESSIDWLRTKGIAKAAKKEGRVASEGLISIKKDESVAAIIEINSETDFVARNEDFQEVVKILSQLAISSNDLDDLLTKKLSNKDVLVKDYLTEMIASIGENINLRRMKKIINDNGVISSYIHNQVVDGMGKIGVLVSLESDCDKSQLSDLGKKIAMHIAATNPISINIDGIPKETLDREKKILIEEAKDSGKPEDIIEKMTEGRLKKFYQESVLLEQTFVVDGESKIEEILNSLDKPVVITEFIRMGLGEGIEKKSEDFANEVDSLIS